MPIIDNCYFALDVLDGFVSYARDNYSQGALDPDMFRQIAFWFFQFVTKCGGLS